MRLILIVSLSVLNTTCVAEAIPSSVEHSETGPASSSSGVTEDPMQSSTNISDHSEPDDTGGFDASTSNEQDKATEVATTSTGQTSAGCGNGIAEGDETCDDGNDVPGDGCQECAKDSIAFVSSEAYQGFALQGLYGADQRCRSLAGKAGLPNHLSFKAWLSTPTMSAADRLLNSKGRYVLVNGLIVAQNWDALTSGALENPINVDEVSQTRNDRVWTGTLANGEPALGSEFCEDWDDDSGLLKFAPSGISMNVDSTWSFQDDDGPCDAEARLYCIEQ